MVQAVLCPSYRYLATLQAWYLAAVLLPSYCYLATLQPCNLADKGRTAAPLTATLQPCRPYCRPSYCYGIMPGTIEMDGIKEMDIRGCIDPRFGWPCEMDTVNVGSKRAELAPAGKRYHDLGALGYDQLDLAYTVDALGRVPLYDGIHTTGSIDGKIFRSDKTQMTSAGYGPLVDPARVGTGRNSAPNCEQQKPGLTDYWAPDPNFAGKCVGTVRAHNPVIEYPPPDSVLRLPHSYFVRYQVADIGFNERPLPTDNKNDPARYMREVQVTDTDAPGLTVRGEDEVIHEGGTPYHNPYAFASDIIDGDVTDKIIESVTRMGTADCDTIRQSRGWPPNSRGCDFPLDSQRLTVYAPSGTPFLVTYSSTDRNNNQATHTRKVRIRDTTPPVIHLNDHTKMAPTVPGIKCDSPTLCGLEGGTVWQDPGAQVKDLLDDDASITKHVASTCVNCQDLHKLKVSASEDAIDSNAKAFTRFRVQYTVSDAAGNAAAPVEREVEIRDLTQPVLTLAVESRQHEAATTYAADQGVTATDTLDGAYPMFPRYSSRIRSAVQRGDRFCLVGQFFDLTDSRGPNLPGACRKIAPACAATEFEKAPPSPTSNRICEPISPSCAAGPETAAPTPSSDRACHRCLGNSGLLEQPVVDNVKPVQWGGDGADTATVQWGLVDGERDTVINTRGTVTWNWVDAGVKYDLVGGTRFNGGSEFNFWEKELQRAVTQGAQLQETFPSAGVYPYYSTAFPSMDGTITAVDPGQHTFRVDWGIAGTAERRLSIARGDTVTFVWQSGSTGVNLIEQSGVSKTQLASPSTDGTFYSRLLSDLGTFRFTDQDNTQAFTVEVLDRTVPAHAPTQAPTGGGRDRRQQVSPIPGGIRGAPTQATPAPTQGNAAGAWDITKLKSMSTNSTDTCYIAIFEGACGSTAGGVYKISKEWYVDHAGGPFAAKRNGAGTCGHLVENWLTISENHGANVLTETRVTYVADFNCDHDTTTAALATQALTQAPTRAPTQPTSTAGAPTAPPTTTNAIILNPATRQAAVIIAPLTDDGLCHEIPVASLVEKLAVHSSTVPGAQLADCKDNTSELAVGIIIYNGLGARVLPRLQAMHDDVDAILQGWHDRDKVSTQVAVNIRWLKDQNSQRDALRRALERRRAEFIAQLEQLQKGSHGVDYSMDGGSTWSAMSLGSAADGHLLQIENVFEASKIRIRVSPGRTFEGRTHIFSYRLWVMVANNDGTRPFILSTSRPFDASAFGSFTEKPSTIDQCTLRNQNLAPAGEAGVVDGMVVIDSAARDARQKGSGSDVAAQEQATEILEIEEDETYTNYRYQTLFYIMRDALPGVAQLQLDRTTLDLSGIGIVGASTFGGTWEWTCRRAYGAKFVPVVNVSTTNVLLLTGGCRIRFQPVQDYNTVLDSDGILRGPGYARPYIKVRVWPSTEDYAKGTMVDLTNIPPAAKQRLLRRDVTSLSVRVMQTPDDPVILHSSTARDATPSEEAHTPDTDTGPPSMRGPPSVAQPTSVSPITYRLVYTEGSDPMHIVNLSVPVTVLDPDGFEMVELKVVVEGATEFDQLMWPDYRLKMLGLNSSTTASFGNLQVRFFPASGFTANTSAYNTALRLVRYRNTNSNDARNTVEIVMTALAKQRPRQIGLPLSVDVFSMRHSDPVKTTVTLVPIDSRPSINLDASTGDVSRWERYNPKSPGDAIYVLERAEVMDESLLTEMVVEMPGMTSLETIALSRKYSKPTPFANYNGSDFTSTTTQNGFVLRGYARADAWSNALQTLSYSNRGPPISIERKIHIKIKDEIGQLSLPEELTIIPADGMGMPWIDLNGNKLGSDILEFEQRIYIEQSTAVVLAPKLTIYGLYPGASLSSARIAVHRAQDNPLELIACDTALQDKLGIVATLDRGGAALNLDGESSVEDYTELLATCTYTNGANEPHTSPNRLVQFTVTANAPGSGTSAAAHVVLRVVSENDAPDVYADGYPSAVQVPQGVPPENVPKISVNQLIGTEPYGFYNPMADPRPRVKDRFTIISCANQGGCTWSDAQSRCKLSAMKMCSRVDLEARWPNGVGTGSHEITLAWTADTLSIDPFDGLGKRQVWASKKPVNGTLCTDCDIDYGQTTESAFLFHGIPDGLRPKFLPARREDAMLGRPVDAVCCDVIEQRQVQATFNQDGIKGIVSFRQQDPASAVRVSITLRGLEYTLAKNMRVHEHPVSFYANVRSDRRADRAKQCSTGKVYGQGNGRCRKDVCTFGRLGDDASVCCPAACPGCDDFQVKPQCRPASVKASGDICAQPGDVACIVLATVDPRCDTGRLSDRHGFLDHNRANADGFYENTYLDSSLSLYGNHTLVGRSVVIFDERDIPVACSTIAIDHVQTLVSPLFLGTARIGAFEVSQVLYGEGEGAAGLPAAAVGRVYLDKATTPVSPMLSWWLAAARTSNFCDEADSVLDLAPFSGALSQDLRQSSLYTFTFPAGAVLSFSGLRVLVSDGQNRGKTRCERLTHVKTRTANINMKGTLGTVTFRQESPSAPVHAHVYLKTYKPNVHLGNSILSVHALPVPRPEYVGANDDEICGEAYTGAVFPAPSVVLCSVAPCGDDPTCCQIPDRGLGKPASVYFHTALVSLFGAKTIDEHAIVLKPAVDTATWICSNIKGGPKMKVAASRSHSITSLPLFFQNGAKSGFDVCFGANTLGAGAKTRLESGIKTLTLHCICRPWHLSRHRWRGWWPSTPSLVRSRSSRRSASPRRRPRSSSTSHTWAAVRTLPPGTRSPSSPCRHRTRATTPPPCCTTPH